MSSSYVFRQSLGISQLDLLSYGDHWLRHHVIVILVRGSLSLLMGIPICG